MNKQHKNQKLKQQKEPNDFDVEIIDDNNKLNQNEIKEIKQIQEENRIKKEYSLQDYNLTELVTKLTIIMNDLQKYFKSLIEDVNEYIKTKRNENESINSFFKMKTIPDLIKEKETLFDQLFETFKRNEHIVSTEKMMIELIDQFTNAMKHVYHKCKEEKESYGILNNQLIDELKELEQATIEEQLLLKGSNEEEMKQKRKLERKHNKNMKINYDKYFYQTREMKTKMAQSFEMVKDQINKKEFKTIEQLTGMKMDSIIFDSQKHQWGMKSMTSLMQKQSEFDSIILNKSKIVFLIETTDSKRFGAFIQSQISTLDEFIPDQSAFIFNISRNKIEKYPIKDNQNAIKIHKSSSSLLFQIGDGDIVIRKKPQQDKSSCVKTSYKYESGVLFYQEKHIFEPKRIIILQMYEDKSAEIKRLRMEKKDLDDRYELFKEIVSFEQMKKMQEWCGRKCESIIFNSDIHDYSKRCNEFEKAIYNRSNLYFLIETTENVRFGFYLNTKVWRIGRISDPNCFVYTFKEGKMKKFDIKENRTNDAFMIHTSNEDTLFSVGFSDIWIYKKDVKSLSRCIQDIYTFPCFEYKGELTNLIGTYTILRSKFKIKRLCVIQTV